MVPRCHSACEADRRNRRDSGFDSSSFVRNQSFLEQEPICEGSACTISRPTASISSRVTRSTASVISVSSIDVYKETHRTLRNRSFASSLLSLASISGFKFSCVSNCLANWSRSPATSLLSSDAPREVILLSTSANRTRALFQRASNSPATSRLAGSAASYCRSARSAA
jgi:hypothetical protein